MTMRVTAASLCLFVLLSALPCAADDWVSAKPIDARSSDGRWAVHIDLGQSLGDSVGFQGAAKGAYAKATLTDPDGAKRTFPLLNPVAPVDVVLLDDGKLVGFDNWHNFGYGTVIACYSPDGSVLWRRELEDLFPADVLVRIPTSVSSRWWRKMSLEWKTTQDETGRLLGLATLWNEHQLKIVIADGTFEIAQVELGEDAERLLRRGQDLLANEKYAEAAEALVRAITARPTLIEAYRTLSDVYLPQERYSLAIQALEDGIHQNPPEGIKPAKGRGGEDPRMHLWTALGRAYVAAGRLQEAEKLWIEFHRIDPTDWYAVEGLAQLWLDQSRLTETDQLLAEYFAVRNEGHDNPRNWDLEDAGRSIGELYATRKNYEKAREYYLRAYRGEYDGLTSDPLAEVLEKLGRSEEALAILRQSREWYVAHGDLYKWNLDKTDESIRRITASIRPKPETE